MKKKRLYIYAPNDRFNYGDLLFPYVLRFYFRKYFDDIVYVSTSESDLSNLGGIPTVGYKALYETDESWVNHLIVAGGESLCVRWNTILSYVKPWVYVTSRMVWKLRRIFGERVFDFFEKIIATVCGTKTYFAFSVGKNELPKFQSIVYNAVGGSRLLESNILQSKKVQKILSSVDVLSVRDDDTSIALTQYNINNCICPDTAIIMSDVFSEQELRNHLSINLQDFNDDYIFFQGNIETWKGKSDLAAKQVEELHKKTGAKICLCPIGTALGHGDDVALRHISEEIHDKKSYMMVTDPNLYDIMWLIKHSKKYIGTSLHGVITAMSFGVPFVGYGSKKQKVFITKWTKGDSHIAMPETFAKVAEKNQLGMDYSDLKELVYKMFSRYLRLYTNYD